MIKIKVDKDQSDNIRSFEMKGHAEFAEYGKDLVCAAATAVSFGSVNAIVKLTKVIPEVKQGQDGGFLKVSFPDNLDQQTNEQVQLIVQAMIVSLQTIEQDYQQHIKISFNR
ncbi:ribosomal-processing cysteine protease Prp [Paenisporosarcina sp. TG20]|uniref:ribosomal-processing cysteine protease Prp n=1 Tax=Paenisporosarcina sp. TG20 TaxID=1211706 RepID=UPI0002D97A07|nr:ribosomal-processing cysteine protease Prp [Paenisporosarcina sp. TG20]